jgi:dihydroflavonol-4-reductase
VAVTGATGFIGSHLVAALRARGDQVTCLVRASSAAAPLESLGCRVVRGDLADPAAVRALVEGAEVVHHVAGRVAAPDEPAFLAANREGTALVAASARAAGASRLVHVSSLAVTGPTVAGHPLDETGPSRPVTPYGRSKAAGEAVVREAGVPFTIVRPPVVYGPRDRELLRIFRLARTGIVPLFGDGTQELSLVHVRDLAQALLAAGDSPRTGGGTYHAAHQEPVTQRGLCEAIGRAVGRRVRLMPLPPALVRSGLQVAGWLSRLTGAASVLHPSKAPELLAPAWTCRSDALERDTGWTAATPLEAGLRETAAWYREQRWL